MLGFEVELREANVPGEECNQIMNEDASKRSPAAGAFPERSIFMRLAHAQRQPLVTFVTGDSVMWIRCVK